jgi:hypothetical protein
MGVPTGALTEANVADLELERVRDDLPVLFDRSDTFFSKVEKRNVEKVSDVAMRVPLEIRPGGKARHFNPDGGALGLGTGPTFDKATVTTQALLYAVQWNVKADWATDSRRKAVLQTVRHLLAKAMAEFRRFNDCLFVGSPGNGVLGTISAADAGTPETLTLGSDGYGIKLLRYAQDIAIFNSDLTTNRTAGTDKTITSYDLVTKKIQTATPTAGAAATDKVVVGGLGNVTGASVVSINGVPYHHSNAATGTWQGMNRANFPEIRANRVNASSGGLALSFARRALNAIGDRVGPENMKSVTAWTHPCQQQAYEELGQTVSIINKQASEQNLNMYFGDGMQLAGAPLKTHYAWDKTRIDFIVLDVWGRAELSPIGYYEVEGRKIFDIRSTADGAPIASNIFYLKVAHQPFVLNPAVCSYIDALAVPTGY